MNLPSGGMSGTKWAVECSLQLKAGAEVHIAYLGEYHAQDGWRPKTLNWFRQQFPDARVSEIKCRRLAEPGSDLGVFRLQHDVLEKLPDLLFIEFRA